MPGASHFAFPNDRNLESESAQILYRATVPLNVRRELIFPEWTIRLGSCRSPTILVSVPEATVHEHGETPTSIGHVWGPGKILVFERVAYAETAEDPSHGEFWLRAGSSYRSHEARSLSSGEQRLTAPRQVALERLLTIPIVHE